jgi:hypothetical protein
MLYTFPSLPHLPHRVCPLARSIEQLGEHLEKVDGHRPKKDFAAKCFPIKLLTTRPSIEQIETIKPLQQSPKKSKQSFITDPDPWIVHEENLDKSVFDQKDVAKQDTSPILVEVQYRKYVFLRKSQKTNPRGIANVTVVAWQDPPSCK